MIRGLVPFLLLGVIAALFEPRPAEACSCGMVRTPGEAFSRASVVFVGTVGEIKHIEKDRYETTFEVHEVFRGQLGKTVVVASRWNGMSCDYGRFPAGERMLIYAGGSGPLYVSGCSGTKRLSAAADDLAYLRRSKASGMATIEGAVMFYDPSGDEESTPRDNVEVRARGTKHATRTDADGKYRLELPPGTYTLEIADPDPSFTAKGTSEPIVLSAAGTWARRDFSVAWNGRIRGRLLDDTGQPAANVIVRALDIEQGEPTSSTGYKYGPSARTDAGGHYEIPHVPKGRYRVAVSVPFDSAFPVAPTYYPGVPTSKQARIVELTRARALAANIDFSLPAPKRLLTIRGVVARARKPSGSRNALVTLLNKTYRRSSETISLDDRTTFELKDVEGSTVKIYACDGSSGDGDCTEPITFTLDRDRTITLTLPE